MANHIAKHLEEDNIRVNVLFLIDAANGPESDQVDRAISGNVDEVFSYYNPDPSTNKLGSHGLPAKKEKEDNKTKVNNAVRITWVNNGKTEKVTHSNIDEASSEEDK